MSKKRPINIDSSTYQKALQKRIDGYAAKMDRVYSWAAGEFAKLGSSIQNVKKDKLFSFSDYPQTNDRVKSLLADMYSKVHLVVKTGIETEWLEAAKKNNDLVNLVFKSSRLTKKQLAKYNDRNLTALKSFQDRKSDGFNLSDRIWKQTQAFKDEMELGIDIGLGEGQSAAQLSQLLRSNLKEPDKLFRRVRNKYGSLVSSKAAQMFNPGQGVYRSSYKNAMRVTRTETNMAYRASDHARWMQLDFVVGIEIKLSNNPNHCPTCIALAGKYPKEFKFVGWHPQCRCFSISILKTDDEIDADDIRILQGKEPNPVSVNQVKDVPAGFKQWISDNSERAAKAKSQPYFIRDNFKNGKIEGGLNFQPGKGKSKPTKPAAVKPDPPKQPIFTPYGIDEYEKGLGITVNRDIFNLLKEPIGFTNVGKGAFYHSGEKIVNIPFDQIRKESKWKAESVVYHEFGHAADWANGLRQMPEITGLMDKYRKLFSSNKNAQFKSIDSKLWDMGFKAFSSKDKDLSHKIAAAHDTIMSLNSNFGSGHTKQYFAYTGKSEAEFIAHLFENKFIGNDVFKSVMPELYDDMIGLADEIIERFSLK